MNDSTTKLKVFISYSSEQESIAEQIYLTLANSQHEVFFDRTGLPPGQDFNPAILSAIRSSDMMIYLISPHSVQDGAYARTELRFARETWPNPAGRVLPVMAEDTPFELIPSYLKAITILRPEGNLAAEVAAAISDLAANRKPEDTIMGHTHLIKETAGTVQELQRKVKLSNLDAEWSRTQSKYLVNFGYGKTQPSYAHIVYYFLLCSIFGYFTLSEAISRSKKGNDIMNSGGTAFFLYGLFAIIVVVFIVISTFEFDKLHDYDRALKRYSKQRLEFLEGKQLATSAKE